MLHRYIPRLQGAHVLIPLLVNLMMLFGSLVLFFAAAGIANNCDNLTKLEERILNSSLFVPGPLHLVALIAIARPAMGLIPIDDRAWLYLPALVSTGYWVCLIVINARKNRYLRAD